MNIAPVNGKASLAAAKYTSIYSAPANCISATVNLRLVSQDLTKNIKTRLAIVSGAFVDGVDAPSAINWISAVDLILGANGVPTGIMEDTGIVLSPGETIVAYADLGFVTARVHGFVKT